MRTRVCCSLCLLVLSLAVFSQSPSSPPRPLPRSESFFGLHFDLHPNNTDVALGADISEENISLLLQREL